MSSIGTGYDLSVTTFSPRFPDRVRHQSRRQQRHRLRHQMQRRSCYASCFKDDVAVLIEESAPFITTPAWLLRDWLQGRQIVARAKSEATNYQSVYGEQIPVKKLAECVASYMHLSTLYWWLRPFGCGIILGGYDRDGPQLYMVEPSGISYRYFGAAIGKGRQAAKIEIEKLKLSEMTCRQGAIKVAKIIYGVHDEAKDKAFELEMSWVCDESSRQHQKVPDDLLEEAKAAAKVALEEMDAD